MKNNNKKISLALVGLLTIALSSKQIHAMDNAVTVAAQAMTQLMQNSYDLATTYESIAQFFGAPQSTITDPTLRCYYSEQQYYEIYTGTTEQWKKELLKMPDYPDMFDAENLRQASRDGNIEIVTTLIDAKKNLDRVDGYGQTALMYAARYCKTNILQKLIDAGANVNIADRDGITALMYATRVGHQDQVDALIAAGARQASCQQDPYSYCGTFLKDNKK